MTKRSYTEFTCDRCHFVFRDEEHNENATPRGARWGEIEWTSADGVRGKGILCDSCFERLHKFWKEYGEA